MDKCIKLRSSPSYSAMDYKGGKKYISKAGVKIVEKDLVHNKYVYKKSLFSPVNVSKFLKFIPPGIVKDINTKPKHIYEILDNRWTPFLVFDYGGHVDVYNQKYNKESDEYDIQGKIMQQKYINIFVGDNDLKLSDYDLKKGEGKGNTILLQTTKNKYIYIGDGIRSFTTINCDIIRKYYSPVGNNVVPYPYAVGDKYVYLMLNNVYQPIEDFDLKKNAYMQYYGWHINLKNIKNYFKKFKDRQIEYPVKVLFKRFY
jgi:hypothetical protein